MIFRFRGKNQTPHTIGTISIICMAVGVVLLAYQHSAVALQKGTVMHAKGPFDVKLAPQDDKIDPALGRMTLDKQYHGDLEGTGKGQMLTGGTDVKTSGVYVAVEKVSGTLNGRKGSFLMHHLGIMERGKPSLSIDVVPDSGTEEIAGISGKMNITIAEGGKHSYDLEYTLPDKK